MKKLIATLLLGTAGLASAQVSLAPKANLLFPASNAKWRTITQTVTEAYKESGKNSAGFNIGLSVKAPLMNSLFIMPELYYTTFKNKYTDPVTNTELEAKSNRVDLPVLVGYNILGETLGIFTGPVASYNLAQDNQFNDFKENATKKFTVGYQVGAQLKIRRILINGRYEAAISQDKREYVANVLGSGNTVVRYDNRPSMLILGAGIQF